MCCHVICFMTLFVIFCCANDDSTLSASYYNEKFLCNSTEALTKVQKIPVQGPFGKDYRFKIACQPLNICNETCEWSDRCTEAEYGNGVFVGGIHSLYYTPDQERYLLLLCCNASSDNEKQLSEFKNYEEPSFVIDAPRNQIVHQMFANHNTENKPWLEVQMCIFNSSTLDACPIVPFDREDSGVAYYAGLSGLAGLAGLAGLVLGGPSSPSIPPCGCTGVGDLCSSPCTPDGPDGGFGCIGGACI